MSIHLKKLRIKFTFLQNYKLTYIIKNDYQYHLCKNCTNISNANHLKLKLQSLNCKCYLRNTFYSITPYHVIQNHIFSKTIFKYAVQREHTTKWDVLGN